MEQESLNKTWFVDIDGTIVHHYSNHTLDEAIEKMGNDSFLTEKPIKKSIDFLNSLPKGDVIVLTTARNTEHKQHTLDMLRHFNVRYDKIMFDLESGPRYVVNDITPAGTAGNDKPIKTAYAINVERDKGIQSKQYEC